MRAALTIVAFSDTALTTWSEPTSSETKLWRAGLSNAVTVPRHSTVRNTIHTVTTPVAVSTNRVNAGSTSIGWVIITIRRLS